MRKRSLNFSVATFLSLIALLGAIYMSTSGLEKKDRAEDYVPPITSIPCWEADDFEGVSGTKYRVVMTEIWVGKSRRLLAVHLHLRSLSGPSINGVKNNPDSLDWDKVYYTEEGKLPEGFDLHAVEDLNLALKRRAEGHVVLRDKENSQHNTPEDISNRMGQ